MRPGKAEEEGERARSSEKQGSRSAWVVHEVESLVWDEHEGSRDGVHVAVVEEQLGKLCLEPDIEEYETRAERYQRMHREALLESLQRHCVRAHGCTRVG